jgi:hypothetical protein
MKSLARSFAGGEITPEMYGRIDTAKRQTGLAKALNFSILPHGPAARRPGFGFVAEARDSTQAVRILPFQFSADQTAVLEFSDEAIRVHIGGQQLLETGKGVVSIVGPIVTVTGHGYGTGDDIFIGVFDGVQFVSGRYHRITVTGADTFTTADRWGNATTALGNLAARVYTITSPYQAADLFDLHYAQDSDVLTLVESGYAARDLARVSATNWTLSSISFAPSGTVPSGVSVTPTVGTPGNQNPQSYCVTSIASDGVTESLPSSIVSTSNNLTVSGNYNTVQWTSTSGVRYNVYKKRGGAFGYIGQIVATGASSSIVDDNVLPDTAKTPPEDIYDLNTGSTDYPGAVTYYEQRRWFAGTAAEPQTVWATRNGTQSNLTSSVPSQDADGLKFRIKAQQQNAIRHLLPLADLIALTVGGEFRIFADNAPNITPDSLSTKPQGFSGASGVQPALTSGSILYVQSQGSHVRELAYNWQSNAYASIDISIMAPHLFDNYSITDVAYCRAPMPALWCVRSDGVLLGMTYVPEQQVYAWHQHTTDGLFESVCVVSEGLEDVLYAVVQRTIDGRTVRYVERLRTRLFADQEDAFFVDAGVTYDSTPTDTLTGLWHLEGEQVSILADGAVHPPRTVQNGEIELEAEASTVHVGLTYTSDLQTLPLAVEMEATGFGTTKNVNGVAIGVYRSSTVKAGPTFDDLVEYPARDVSDNYGDPPALRSGELRFDISPDWNADGQVCIRQEDPLPLTVRSIVFDTTFGG